MTPSHWPSCSTNKNQLTDLPVSASTFCHRPATEGSAAFAELPTATSAKNPASASFRMCTIIKPPFPGREQNQYGDVDAAQIVAGQCGDLATRGPNWPGAVRPDGRDLDPKWRSQRPGTVPFLCHSRSRLARRAVFDWC